MSFTHRKSVLLLLASFICLILAVSAQKPAAAQSSNVPCQAGEAVGFPCSNVDLLAHMPLEMLGGAPEEGVLGNDNWAWVSPETGNMYVLFGLRNATSFIDVTNPTAPIYLGTLPGSQAGLSDYRDMKVFDHYAFIVADTPLTAHGMQIFDLSKLDSVDRDNAPVIFSEDAHYDGMGFGHNIWINEATGFAYVFRSDTCDAGTHMIDINDPLNPTFAGCLIVDGADSDAECLVYNGPDTAYDGHELCFVGSDSTLGIADVSDKANPVVIANFTYPNIRRGHQGTLTADHSHWIVSDTMDEELLGFNTRTIIIDITDLANPQFVRYHEHATTARDHNVYLAGPNLLLETNWRAGLRVFDISDFENWQEIGYFDTYPANDGIAAKSGSWSHYDWLPNGTIVVSDVESGLFLLRIRFAPTDVSLTAVNSAETDATFLLFGIGGALLTAGLAGVVLRRRSHLIGS